MGYQLADHEPYIITGKDGKTEYKIPAQIDMNFEAIEIVLRFNKSEDEIEKTKICKEFFLHFAPELEKEGISDMEYFYIFEDYNKGKVVHQKRKLGEN